MAADPSVFRKQALDKFASPEQLNTLLQVRDAKAWLLLLACAWLVASALAWGIWGEVPNRVQASGILIHSAGLADVGALAAGQVTALTVDVGDEVRPGDVIARVAQPELVAEIESLRAQVEELKRTLWQKQLASAQDVQLRSVAVSSERAGLLSLIDAAQKEQRDLQTRLVAQQELLARGLVTQEAVLTTQREIRAAENAVKQRQAELQRTASNNFTVRRTNEAELQADGLRITELERRIVVSVDKLQQQGEIVSTQAGRVVELRATLGDVVAPGMPIVSLERVAEKGALEAILYLDSRIGKRVQAGMKVNLSPSTVRRERYGVILAEITRVEGFASTRRGMMRVLHNEALVDALLAETGSAPMALRARLVRDDKTPSGYRWSSGQGPRLLISSGTRLDASITTSTQRPISLVFRLFDSTD
jgi:HlyD family secretion protein